MTIFYFHNVRTWRRMLVKPIFWGKDADGAYFGIFNLAWTWK